MHYADVVNYIRTSVLVNEIARRSRTDRAAHHY